MSRDDPALADVRVKLDKIEEDEITVVEIGDVDIAACSGIHVMETSELSALFVDRVVSAGKGEYAVHFKIGASAIDSAMELANTCLQVIDETGSKPEDIVRTVGNMGRELESGRKMLKEASVAALNAVVPEDAGGVPMYMAVIPADRTTLTEAAERFKSQAGVAILVSPGESTSVILASGTPRVDCRAILPEILKSFGGRGGGKPDFAQGGIPDPGNAKDVLNAIADKVRASLH
jgi:alanyl-tRNA synthetase